MSNPKRSHARVQQTLDILVTSGEPMSLSQVAKQLGCAPSTAAQYLLVLRRHDEARSSGFGCKATWSVGRSERKQEADRRRYASVWHYAAGVAW